MNYFKLTTTTQDVLDRIAEAEKNGTFNEHLDPIDYSNCYPVTKDFPYVPTGKVRRHYFIHNLFIVRPFQWIVTHRILKVRVTGKENIKGIKSAVVTGNHVNKLDAIAIGSALGRKNSFKVMVGDFNNQKGNLGDYMRAFGVLPFSAEPDCVRAFNKAVSYYLKHGTYLLFFPERAEWWCYEKPRPLMDGAYHYAVKNKVPVIPTFITFRNSGKIDENGIEQRYFQVNILKPIYPDPTLTNAENIKIMKKNNFDQCVALYEKTYNKHYDLPIKDGIMIH